MIIDQISSWPTNVSTEYQNQYSEQRYLAWIDYFLLAITLFTSFLIGLYFGWAKKQTSTTFDYLFGGKSMSVLPIALSLAATQVSGNIMIALPADIYKFGSNYIWTLLSDAISFLVTLLIFLPVYHNLQLVSIFEYLELRFDETIRRLASVLHTVYVVFYCPIAIYLPSLMFAQVTGMGTYFITIIISAICILYTTIGGFKAVVWTDVLQVLIMAVSIISILTIGMQSVNGIGNALKIAKEHSRFDIFDFSFDLTSRHTFWAQFIGNFFLNLSVVAVNQNCIQKYLALSSFKEVKRCILLHFIAYLVLQVTIILLSNVMYARYAECDLFQSKKILRTDELIPYFVMDITQNYPGLPGLFVAGVLSAALSTLSSALNGTATSIHKDLILPFINTNISSKTNTKIIKAVVVILGIVCLLLALIVEKVGGVFPFAKALRSISGGPTLGIFVLGLLFPKANGKSVLLGALSGIVFTGWILFGNTWYRTSNLLPNEEKPASIENCSFYINQTIKSSELEHDIFILYRICFWYYSAIGTISVIIIGLIVSWITKGRSATINPELLSSAVYYCLQKNSDPEVYYNVNTIHNSNKNDVDYNKINT